VKPPGATTTRITVTGHAPAGERATIDLPPAFVREYAVGDLLGAGAMGSVYRAEQRSVKRAVALKVLKTATPDLLARFHREGRVLARISHPNVLAVYDCGDFDGCPYLVTELLEGGSLRDRLTTALPVAEALRIGTACLDGLAACHERGIIHRDIKPENILRTAAGEPKLADLGVAFDEVESVSLTKTGALVGTPLYMAPEVLMGESADPASDLWAMAAVIYEMLALAPPVTGHTLGKLMEAHLVAPIVPLHERVPGVPRAVSDAVAQALAREPGKRPPSAAALAHALRERPPRRKSSTHIKTIPAPPAPSPAPYRRARWAFAAGTAALLLTLSLLPRAEAPRPPASPPPPTPSASPSPSTPPRVATPPSAESPPRLQRKLLATARVSSSPVDPPEPLPEGAVLTIGGESSGRAVVSRAGTVVAALGRGISVWDPATGRELKRLSVKNFDDRLLALSGDGEVVAVQEKYGELLVWEWRGQSPPISLGRPDPSLGISDFMSLSHDGRRIAVGYNKALAVIDLTSDTTRIFPCATDVTRARFARDGALIATGHMGGEVTLRDVATGRIVHSSRDHRAPPQQKEAWVSAVELSPDGAWLASGGNDGRLVVRSVATRATAWERTLPATVDALAWSQDSRSIAVEAGWTIQVLPANGAGKPLEIPDCRGHLAFTESGDRLIVALEYQTNPPVARFDLPGGQRASPNPERAPRQFKHIRFTSDGRRLLGFFDNRLGLRDAATGRHLRTERGIFSERISLGSSNGADRISIARRDTVAQFDVEAWRSLREVPAKSQAGHTLSRDGHVLAWIGTEAKTTVHVLDTRDGRETRTELPSDGPFLMEFDGAAGRLAVFDDAVLYFIDTRSGALTKRASELASAEHLKFLPGDGLFVLIGGGSVQVHDVVSGETDSWRSKFPCRGLVPDATAAITCEWTEDTILLVDFRTSEVRRTIQLPKGTNPWSFAFTNDMKRLATNHQSYLMIWDTAR
jgi:serine/threonine protein kinase